MKKLLVINATLDKETSHTYFTYKHLIEKIDTTGYEIIEHNLFDMQLPLYDGMINAARHGRIEKRDIDLRIDSIVEEFTNADAYVFVTPTWNLTVPSVLKNYIDLMLVGHKSYKYEGHKRIGMLEERRALIINTSGWETEHADSYLVDICRFINLDHHVCHVHGTSHRYKDFNDMLLDVAVNPNIFQIEPNQKG